MAGPLGFIVIVRKGQDSRRFPMVEETCCIGKSLDCDIRIHNENIGVKQALITVGFNGKVTLRNLNPSVPVMVNNKKITSENLTPGQMFSIHNKTFRWESAGTTQSIIPKKRRKSEVPENSTVQKTKNYDKRRTMAATASTVNSEKKLVSTPSKNRISGNARKSINQTRRNCLLLKKALSKTRQSALTESPRIEKLKVAKTPAKLIETVNRRSSIGKSTIKKNVNKASVEKSRIPVKVGKNNTSSDMVCGQKRKLIDNSSSAVSSKRRKLEYADKKSDSKLTPVNLKKKKIEVTTFSTMEIPKTFNFDRNKRKSSQMFKFANPLVLDELGNSSLKDTTIEEAKKLEKTLKTPVSTKGNVKTENISVIDSKTPNKKTSPVTNTVAKNQFSSDELLFEQSVNSKTSPKTPKSNKKITEEPKSCFSEQKSSLEISKGNEDKIASTPKNVTLENNTLSPIIKTPLTRSTRREKILNDLNEISRSSENKAVTSPAPETPTKTPLQYIENKLSSTKKSKMDKTDASGSENLLLSDTPGSQTPARTSLRNKQSSHKLKTNKSFRNNTVDENSIETRQDITIKTPKKTPKSVKKEHTPKTVTPQPINISRIETAVSGKKKSLRNNSLLSGSLQNEYVNTPVSVAKTSKKNLISPTDRNMTFTFGSENSTSTPAAKSTRSMSNKIEFFEQLNASINLGGNKTPTDNMPINNSFSETPVTGSPRITRRTISPLATSIIVDLNEDKSQKGEHENNSYQENVSNESEKADSDTPKNHVKLELESLKHRHSTAKKLSRTSLNASLNESRLSAKQLFRNSAVTDSQNVENASNVALRTDDDNDASLKRKSKCISLLNNSLIEKDQPQEMSPQDTNKSITQNNSLIEKDQSQEMSPQDINKSINDDASSFVKSAKQYQHKRMSRCSSSAISIISISSTDNSFDLKQSEKEQPQIINQQTLEDFNVSSCSDVFTDGTPQTVEVFKTPKTIPKRQKSVTPKSTTIGNYSSSMSDSLKFSTPKPQLMSRRSTRLRLSSTNSDDTSALNKSENVIVDSEKKRHTSRVSSTTNTRSSDRSFDGVTTPISVTETPVSNTVSNTCAIDSGKQSLQSSTGTPSSVCTDFDFNSVKTPMVPFDKLVSPSSTKQNRSTVASIENDSFVENRNKQVQKFVNDLPLSRHEFSGNESFDISGVNKIPKEIKTLKSSSSNISLHIFNSDYSLITDEETYCELVEKGETSNSSGIMKSNETPVKEQICESFESKNTTRRSSKVLETSMNRSKTDTKETQDETSEIQNSSETRTKSARNVTKSPKNDLTDVRGLKKLLKTPKVYKSPKNDLMDVRGLKKLLKTPKVHKSPKNDLMDVRGLKKLLKTPKVYKSPKNDLTDVKGLKKLLTTPKVQKSPQNDLTQIRSVKHLFKSPQNKQKSPKNDLTNVKGVKKLLSTPKVQKSPKNDLGDVRGVKELFRTPRNKEKSPENDLTNVDGIKRLYKEAEAEAKLSTNVSGVADIFRTSDSDEDSNDRKFTALTGKRSLVTYSRQKISPKKSPLKRLSALDTSNETVEKWIEEQNVLKEMDPPTTESDADDIKLVLSDDSDEKQITEKRKGTDESSMKDHSPPKQMKIDLDKNTHTPLKRSLRIRNKLDNLTPDMTIGTPDSASRSVRASRQQSTPIARARRGKKPLAESSTPNIKTKDGTSKQREPDQDVEVANESKAEPKRLRGRKAVKVTANQSEETHQSISVDDSLNEIENANKRRAKNKEKSDIVPPVTPGKKRLYTAKEEDVEQFVNVSIDLPQPVNVGPRTRNKRNVSQKKTVVTIQDADSSTNKRTLRSKQRKVEEDSNLQKDDNLTQAPADSSTSARKLRNSKEAKVETKLKSKTVKKESITEEENDEEIKNVIKSKKRTATKTRNDNDDTTNDSKMTTRRTKKDDTVEIENIPEVKQVRKIRRTKSTAEEASNINNVDTKLIKTRAGRKVRFETESEKNDSESTNADSDIIIEPKQKRTRRQKAVVPEIAIEPRTTRSRNKSK